MRATAHGKVRGFAFPKPVKVHAQPTTQSGVLKSGDGRTYKYNKGDYQVWDDRGQDKAWIVAKEIFELTYRRVADNSYQKKAIKTPFWVADKDGIIKTLEGVMTYNKGDYIVTGPKGEEYPMAEERFKQRYHKVHHAEQATTMLQHDMVLDLSHIVPGMPEHAALTTWREYRPLQLLMETANVTTAVGKLGVYLAYYGIYAYLKDKKIEAPRSLMDDLMSAHDRVPVREIMRLRGGKEINRFLASKSYVPGLMRNHLSALRGFNREVREMVRIPEEERKLLSLAIRVCREKVSESGVKSLERMAWMISPDLGGKILQYAHPDEKQTSKARSTNSNLTALQGSLKALVKKLGGSGYTLGGSHIMELRSRAATEAKYKEYLAVRRDIRKLFDIEYRKLIVNNNNQPMPVEKAEKAMRNAGFELLFMPTKRQGFDGMVGVHGGRLAIYTNAGVMIQGNIAPGSKVTMNRKYNSDRDDNYVMKVQAPGAITQGNRFYTINYRKGAVVQKFQKADDLSRLIPKLLKAWKNDLRSKDDSIRMHATAATMLYLTSARVGSKLGMQSKRGVKSQGILTLHVENVRFTSSSVIITYAGKKGVQQKHTIPLANTGTKIIGRNIRELVKGKDKQDLLFTIPSITGRRDIAVTYSSFSKYLKSLGFTHGAHKLRHVRGTNLAQMLFNKYDWKPSRNATTLSKRQREAETFVKDRILNKVADLLGHRSDGGKQLAWRTSIQSYINPNVVRDWFVKNELDVPNWVPAKVSAD